DPPSRSHPQDPRTRSGASVQVDPSSENSRSTWASRGATVIACATDAPARTRVTTAARMSGTTPRLLRGPCAGPGRGGRAGPASGERGEAFGIVRLRQARARSPGIPRTLYLKRSLGNVDGVTSP